MSGDTAGGNAAIFGLLGTHCPSKIVRTLCHLFVRSPWPQRNNRKRKTECSKLMQVASKIVAIGLEFNNLWSSRWDNVSDLDVLHLARCCQSVAKQQLSFGFCSRLRGFNPKCTKLIRKDLLSPSARRVYRHGKPLHHEVARIVAHASQRLSREYGKRCDHGTHPRHANADGSGKRLQ